jgi:hypothetical protein
VEGTEFHDVFLFIKQVSNTLGFKRAQPLALAPGKCQICRPFREIFQLKSIIKTGVLLRFWRSGEKSAKWLIPKFLTQTEQYMIK